MIHYAQITRRHALRTGLKSAAGLFAAPYVVPRSILGGDGHVAANDRVHIGVIGIGARGKYLIANMPPEGRIVSLCDCFLPRIDSATHPQQEFAQTLTQFKENDARHCTKHQDYRRMLDETSLDAVMIATPDHHHVPAAMLACQAGLDLYVEKPLSLTIAEGRALAGCVKKHKRVLQVGSQQRTMAVNQRGCAFVREGGLGKVHRVELRNLPGPMPYESLPEEKPPKGLDWDLFCGPAPHLPHNVKLWDKDNFRHGYLLWRGWDLWRDFSGHLMTNWGGHSVDMMQLSLGLDHTGPVEIVPLVDRSQTDLEKTLDDEWHEKTPPFGSVADRREDRMRFCPVALKYANGVEVRLVPGLKRMVIHGEKGTLAMNRNSFQSDPPELISDDADPQEKVRWSGKGHVARPHIENWLECVKTRNEPNASVEAGHRTATICHLINICRQLVRRLEWDPVSERFVGDDAANALLSRKRRGGYELPTV